MKKIKIINDPVSGFISISDKLILDIIDHPYFQRLRGIKQLGLTYLVFPGAMHTRFQHALGAFQLMSETLDNLKQKGVEITDEESEAVLIAILLHDIGHGPFSHALEKSIVENVDHEKFSLLFINHLADLLGEKSNLVLKIFQNQHPKKFLNKLISSQLDIDRLDYLRRDSFYTGVLEGTIGSGRIIRMMNVRDNNLVIEQKGIYSVENFLISRRSMYWQVYLHKTVISAEQILVKILERAKVLALNGNELFAAPNLKYFLYNVIKLKDFNNPKVLNNFAYLDDSDIALPVKVWQDHSDKVLSLLCRYLIQRNLFKVELSKISFSEERINNLRKKVSHQLNISIEDSKYFVFEESVRNSLYDGSGERINILLKNDEIVDFSNETGGFDMSLMKEPQERFFLCYPKL